MSKYNGFGNKRRDFLKGATALSVGGATLIAGCTGAGDETTAAGDETLDTLTVALTADTGGGIDPHQTGSVPASQMMYYTYESLVRRGPEGEIMPQLATDWERIEPGQFRFHLVEDAIWHNGDEFTAEDVRYSIRRIVDDDFGGIRSDRRAELEGITDAEIIDDYTIDIISDGLNTNVMTAMGSYLGFMCMNKDWVENNDNETLVSSMMGTGPYELTEFEENDYAILERFDEFYRELPPFETIEIEWIPESSTRVNSLLTGEAHVIDNIPPEEISRVNDNEGTSVNSVPSSRVCYLWMDMTQEPWDSLEFRRAMNYAVNSEEYIEEVMDGFAVDSNQPVLPEMFGYDPDIEGYGYDPERAEELVEESGHAGIELELLVPVGRFVLGEEVGQAIGNYIDSLSNVSCSIEFTEYSSYLSQLGDPDEIGGDFDFGFMGSGQPSFNGIGTYALSLMYPDSSSSRWYSEAQEEAQELFEEYSIVENEGEREEIIQEISRIAVDDACWVFCHQQQSIAGQDDRIELDVRQDELLSVRDAGLE